MNRRSLETLSRRDALKLAGGAGVVHVVDGHGSGNPDPDVISSIGMRNARLSGVQGTFQLGIIVLMVYLRWGGF